MEILYIYIYTVETLSSNRNLSQRCFWHFLVINPHPKNDGRRSYPALNHKILGLPPKWFDLYPADNCCFPDDFPMISPVFPHDFPILLPFFSLTILPSPTHEWQAKSVLSVAWQKMWGFHAPKYGHPILPQLAIDDHTNPQILIDSIAIPTHIAEKARHHHSVDVKKRDGAETVFAQTLLHTDTFTQTFSHRDVFTRTKTFTHRRFYRRRLLHTDPFTHIVLHTDAEHMAFTPDTFPHRSFHWQTLTHTDARTDKTHYTHQDP